MKNHQPRTLRPLLLALAVAGLAGALSGCNLANSKAADAPKNAGPAVSAAQVVERSMTETREFSGRLEAIDQVEIRARVGGMITAVHFKPGSQVSKGDILFTIDPRPFEAELAHTEAAVGAAQAKAELAKLELARADKLMRDNAIAKREFDEKASVLKEFDAHARAAQAQHAAARLNLSFTQVRAPISGRVGKAELSTGNLIDASTVLTNLVSLDRIYASFSGDEDTFLSVAAGARRGATAAVKVGLANESGFPHEGKLEFVDNQLDARTGSVRMRAVFDNKDQQLVPGLFVRVQLASAATGAPALLVNESAVGNDQDRKFVVVIGANGMAEYRTVKLGQSSGGLRVVREGLKPGEKIIVSGLQRAQHGAPVSAQLVQMQEQPPAKLARAPEGTTP